MEHGSGHFESPKILFVQLYFFDWILPAFHICFSLLMVSMRALVFISAPLLQRHQSNCEQRTFDHRRRSFLRAMLFSPDFHCEEKKRVVMHGYQASRNGETTDGG